ncbi:MAG: dihydrodipicolinate synthase family protein [Pyrinomonadaceae bacterium]
MKRTGLSVPIITVLDDAGDIIEADQRQVIRYAIQDGRGANSLFLSGTTGEFDKLSKRQRQRIIEIGCEETRIINARLPPRCERVEAWAGVTAPTKAETLENLALAVELRADMAVIAPMAIKDLALREIGATS